MITTREVPTSTPIPIVEINLSCDCESVKDKGKIPARKEARAMTMLKLSSVKRPSMVEYAVGLEGV